MPRLAAERIKRWAMLLAAFEYTIEFISGKHKMDADFSSRKPFKSGRHTGEQVSEYVMFMKGDQFLYTVVVALKTKRSPVLSKLLQYIWQGWLDKPGKVPQPFYSKRLDLSHKGGDLLRSLQVIIPKALYAFNSLPACRSPWCG